MRWIADALKQPFKKGDTMSKKEKLANNPPKPPKDVLQQATVLSEEEQKIVPGDEKDMYLRLKETRPQMAQDLLEEYRKKANDKEKIEVTQAELHMIRNQERIMAQLDSLVRQLEHYIDET